MPLDLPPADKRMAARSSVHMVACEVRFDEHETVGSGPVGLEFQKLLGGTDGPYTKLEAAASGNLRIQMGPGGPIPQTTEQRGWSLESADGWSLGLLPGSMTLQVSQAYGGCDDFLEHLKAALKALQELVSPSVEHRLGLRVVDRIPGADVGVEEPAGWERFIAPSFLGPIAVPEIAQVLEVVQQQLVLRLGDGVQCSMRHGLGAMVMSESSQTEYVVDVDLFREGVRAFDSEAILGVVGGFSGQAESLFGLVATPALLESVTT